MPTSSVPPMANAIGATPRKPGSRQMVARSTASTVPTAISVHVRGAVAIGQPRIADRRRLVVRQQPPARDDEHEHGDREGAEHDHMQPAHQVGLPREIHRPNPRGSRSHDREAHAQPRDGGHLTGGDRR